MKNEKGNCLLGGFLLILTGAIIILFFIGLFSLKLDFASGQHRITPTSIDTDMWGNYKVYYRTSNYTQNNQEDYYYIKKEDTELAEKMKEYVAEGKEVVVYYDKWVGFKGISAPGTSPITKIEEINSEEEN